MQLEYAFIAADAAIDADGTTISAQRIGITRLTVAATPVLCPPLSVVLSVRFAPDEFDRQNDIGLHFVGPDGLHIAPPWDWQIYPSALGARPPDPFFANHAMRYEEVTLCGIGRYECRILLDGVEVKAIALDVVPGQGIVPVRTGLGASTYPS